MMLIPLSGEFACFRLRTTLEGITCALRFSYSDRPAPEGDTPTDARAGAWRADLIAGDGTPLIRGEALVPGRPLFPRRSDPRGPPGIFLVVDEGGGGDVFAQADLGARLKVLYATTAEILASTPTIPTPVVRAP